MPFFDGHILMPPGPVKLALSAGAPIVPVFAVRAAGGRIRVFIEPAVVVEPGPDGVRDAMRRLAAVLEKYVRAHPEQWLMVQRAWCEDQVPDPYPSRP
jgi:KDO2-lipid IV(A) lauroyltransferase